MNNSAHAQQVKISDFENFSLGSWNGVGDLTDEDSLCIYNGATSNYRVRARGSGPGFTFNLSGTGGDVPFEVRFKESAGSYVSLTADTYQNFSGANTTDDDCGFVNNADMEVKVTNAALSAAPAGSYSGTLTVLLETR